MHTTFGINTYLYLEPWKPLQPKNIYLHWKITKLNQKSSFKYRKEYHSVECKLFLTCWPPRSNSPTSTFSRRYFSSKRTAVASLLIILLFLTCCSFFQYFFFYLQNYCLFSSEFHSHPLVGIVWGFVGFEDGDSYIQSAFEIRAGCKLKGYSAAKFVNVVCKILDAWKTEMRLCFPIWTLGLSIYA